MKTAEYEFLGDEIINLNRLLNWLLKFLPLALIGIAAGSLTGYLINLSQPKIYESSVLAELLISKANKILNPLQDSSNPSHSNEIYEQYAVIAKTRAVMDMTANKLKSKGISADGIGFSMKILPLTNILSFEAKGPDASVLQAAAWAWEESAIDFLENLSSQNLQEGRYLLSSQYQQNKKLIEDTQNKIERIKPLLETKKMELKIKTEQSLQYGAQLEKSKLQITNAQIQLPILKTEIAKYEKFSPLEHRPNETDPLATSIFSGNASDGKAKSNEIKLINYGTNPIFADLEKRIAEYEIALQTLAPTNEQIEKMQRQLTVEIATLQKSISEESVLLDSLERDLQVAKKSYDLIYGKLGESNFFSSLAFANIQHLSPPTAPVPINNSIPYVSWGLSVGLLAGFLFHIRKGKARAVSSSALLEDEKIPQSQIA